MYNGPFRSKKKPMKGIRFMKKVLIGCFFILLVFTAVALFANFKGIEISDSLIYSFFGAFGVEALVSAVIKISEVKTDVTDASEGSDVDG
jgi:hypothetical protein